MAILRALVRSRGWPRIKTRRKFGKVLTPLTVFSARMPLAFGSVYGKVAKLDKKLELPPATAMLVRQRVSNVNSCHFCIDMANPADNDH